MCLTRVQIQALKWTWYKHGKVIHVVILLFSVLTKVFGRKLFKFTLTFVCNMGLTSLHCPGWPKIVPASWVPETASMCCLTALLMLVKGVADCPGILGNADKDKRALQAMDRAHKGSSLLAMFPKECWTQGSFLSLPMSYSLPLWPCPAREN